MQLAGRKFNILEIHLVLFFLLSPIKEVRDHEYSSSGNFQPLALPLLVTAMYQGMLVAQCDILST